MSATLMYVGIGSLLALGVATLTIAVLFLQTARRYVDLTERRLELLREGEAFLLKIVQRQGRALEESREREAEQREKVPEMVGYVLGRQQDEEFPGSRQPEDLNLRPREAHRKGASSAKNEESGQAASRRGDDAPLLGVQVPHPDDDVPGRGWNRSPARFFQKCYDRYLEHYEGYVRLAERLRYARRGESQALGDRSGRQAASGPDAMREHPEDGHAGTNPSLRRQRPNLSARHRTPPPGLTERFGVRTKRNAQYDNARIWTRNSVVRYLRNALSIDLTSTAYTADMETPPARGRCFGYGVATSPKPPLVKGLARQRPARGRVSVACVKRNIKKFPLTL